jgi:hypothetical protein
MVKSKFKPDKADDSISPFVWSDVITLDVRFAGSKLQIYWADKAQRPEFVT